MQIMVTLIAKVLDKGEKLKLFEMLQKDLNISSKNIKREETKRLRCPLNFVSVYAGSRFLSCLKVTHWVTTFFIKCSRVNKQKLF